MTGAEDASREVTAEEALRNETVEFVSLPISATWSGDRRLEAETYLTGGFGMRAQIEAALPYRRVRDLADVSQPHRLKGIQVGPESGMPFLTATQVFDMRPVVRKWLAPSKTNQVASRTVEKGTILVTCSGNVGDPVIAYAAHEGAIVSHDLLRVLPHSPNDRGSLYCFLRSRFGRAMLRSSRYGSVVKHLEPEHVLEVPVPDVPDVLAALLNRRIAEVFELREQAYRDTLEAERIYAERFPELSVEEDESGFVRPIESTWAHQRRLDAHYYNPRARAVIGALEGSRVPLVPLSEVTSNVFGVPRFKHVYRPDGIPYLDSEDLFKLNPELDKFIPEVTKKDADRYYVDRGWLLMASSGQLYGFNGNAVLANEWHERKIVSNHVLRIVPQTVRPGYLLMALTHPNLGRPLVLRTAFGSEIPEIPPESLLDIPIPRLGTVEDEIAERVEGADGKRSRARVIEDAAVADLERHLEKVLHGDDESDIGRDGRVQSDLSAAEALRLMTARSGTTGSRRRDRQS